MNPILILLGLAGIGGAVYAFVIRPRQQPQGGELPPGYSTGPQGPLPGQPPMGPAPTGPLPPPSTTIHTPVPPGTSPTGNIIVTLTTAAEAPQSLPLVEPAKQPKKPSESQLTTARSIVDRLQQLLVNNPDGPNYVTVTNGKVTGYKNRMLFDLIKQFQGAMNLFQDGLYGPATAGAIQFLLGWPPPPPFFYTPPRSIKIYRPMP